MLLYEKKLTCHLYFYDCVIKNQKIAGMKELGNLFHDGLRYESIFESCYTRSYICLYEKNKKGQSMKLGTLLVVGFGVMLSSAVVSAKSLEIDPLSSDHDVKVVLDMNEYHFSVTGGCNTMMGKVHVTDRGAFRVKQGRHGGGLASTMMACPDPLQKLDDRISRFILNTPKMVRQGDDLYLVGTVANEAASVYLPVELDQGNYLDISAKPYEQVFYYVSEAKIPCSEDSQKQCLQVRKDQISEWEEYPGVIEGFMPIEGYEYRLRLKEYQNDDGSKKHVLDMVVEQGKIMP